MRSSLARLRVSKYSTSQPASNTPTNSSPPPPRDNAYKSYYKGFGRPVALNFLVAMATFQAIYWSWLKLESIEEKSERGGEIASLTRELKDLTDAAKTEK